MDTFHKHRKYRKVYKPFDYYWGLGIEHETYIQTRKTKHFHTFTDHMYPERYSVQYYKAYKPSELMEVIRSLMKEKNSLEIPILLNSHSFTDVDIYGEHATSYEKRPKNNVRFAGETVHTWALKKSAWLNNEYERSYMWDGDTVEFMTQHYYKATVDDVLSELSYIENSFIEALCKLPKEGIFAEYGPFAISPVNYPWATYLTNINNISMFNNGTIHLNCTLPTRLDAYCSPLWALDFRLKHQRLARLIQWMEPFWIAVYGSGDPFSAYKNTFASGSQRLAVSRYIGLGTFDTEIMKRGKINQIPRDFSANPWYNEFYAKTAYIPNDIIGLDINFNKHWAHGLELRFFDQMSMGNLKIVMSHLVQIMDASISKKTVCSDARKNTQWHTMAVDALCQGKSWKVQPEQMDAIYHAFALECNIKEPLAVESALEMIINDSILYRGECWDKMMVAKEKRRKRSWCCFSC
jgi:hypothetical protein